MNHLTNIINLSMKRIKTAREAKLQNLLLIMRKDMIKNHKLMKNKGCTRIIEET